MTGKEKNKEEFISSVDLMRRTGLSRATLNNYIKAGIFPPPIVKKPYDPKRCKAKRIGYFPYSVLGIFNRIIQYKEKGYSMREIVNTLAQKPISLSDNTDITEIRSKNRRSKNHLGSESGELFYLDDFSETQNQSDMPIRENNHDSRRRSNLMEVLLKRDVTTPFSFSVLVTDLQDSNKICAEMQPDEYLKLINQVWNCIKSSFNKFPGIYGKHFCNGVVYYFLKDRESKYLMNPIYCAFEIKKKMVGLNSEWKQNKRWDKKIYLNIGINEGYEFFGKIQEAPNFQVMPLGDTTQYASQLSRFARGGSIWTTRNLLLQLDQKERKTICYGIRGNDSVNSILIENTFSKIADLIPPGEDRHVIFRDISTMTVTEIDNIR